MSNERVMRGASLTIRRLDGIEITFTPDQIANGELVLENGDMASVEWPVDEYPVLSEPPPNWEAMKWERLFRDLLRFTTHKCDELQEALGLEKTWTDNLHPLDILDKHILRQIHDRNDQDL